jgi:hypothetical protein
VNVEMAIREILRLRDVQRRADPSLGSEIGQTIDALSGAIGRSVKKAVAARLLGISQTALDRWIAAGDIGVVQTPSGRTEVPLRELLELLEELPSIEDSARPVSAALKKRRRESRIGVDLIPWAPHGVEDNHRRADLRSLAYHRALTKNLDERAVEQARILLDRWERDGHIDPRWTQEWRQVLERPIAQIAELIGADTQAAADLRQTSPFAGSLSERERREILRAVDNSMS